MRYSLTQGSADCGPFGPSFPPQPRVFSRNQPLLPSLAPRNVNISAILSTLRILPGATGLPTMVGVYYPCSLALCLCASACPDLVGVANPICRPFVFSCLQTLFLSLRSFPRSHQLFSIACGLFLQNTRGGIPLRDLVRCTEAQKCLFVSPLLATRCTEAQKCLFVSPLLATLTHSVSRKSFPCHSYANTRDGSVTIAPVSAFVLVSVQPRTSNLEPLPLRALDTAGSAAYGFAQRSRGNRKLR